jgi:hypothetical protein
VMLEAVSTAEILGRKAGHFNIPPA